MLISHSNSFPLNFPIGESAASASWDRKGEKIHEGKIKACLKLGSSEDLRFCIPLSKRFSQHQVHNDQFLLSEKEKKTFALFQTLQGQKVVVKIKNLKRRLHLNKDWISTLISNPQTAIYELNKRADQLSPIIAEYDKIIQKVDLKETQLPSRKISFTAKNLMKIVSSFMTQDYEFLKKHTYSNEENLKKFYEISKKSLRLLARFNKKNELKILIVGQQIGSGCYSKIYDSLYLNKGCHLALKEIYNQDAIVDHHKQMANEVKLLKKIHKDSQPIWGIQSKPNYCIQIYKGDDDLSEPSLGYLGTEYDCDLFDYIQNLHETPEKSLIENFNLLLPIIHQLLFGLKVIHEREILHGDIKSENILIKYCPDGLHLAHLSDFGGSRDITGANLSTIVRMYNTKSGEYYSVRDEKNEAKFFREKSREKYVLQEQKRDVFALGITIYSLFTNESPYKNEEVNGILRPTLEEPSDFDEMLKFIPTPLSYLIMDMIDPNASRRPTAAEAFKQFKKFIKEECPSLYDQIQNKINDEGFQKILKN